jgi:hypothetical protein
MEMTDRTLRAKRDFTPALPQLWAYGRVVAALVREAKWRVALLRQPWAPALSCKSPTTIAEASFSQIDETAVISTPTGFISLYCAIRLPE